MAMHVQMNYRYPGLEAGPDMDWGLLIRNISRQEDMHVTCSWGGDSENEQEAHDYPYQDEYDALNTEEEGDDDRNYSSSGNNSSVFSMRDETSPTGNMAPSSQHLTGN